MTNKSNKAKQGVGTSQLKDAGRSALSTINSFIPTSVGHKSKSRCLCIGLDIAWYGGSKGKPDSQYDCLVSAIYDPNADEVPLVIKPIKLIDRDEKAEHIFCEIKKVIEDDGVGLNVVLAIDAPLQAISKVPKGRKKARRTCEDVLSNGRQGIDRLMGGACGWHPTIQPGIPLPPRVENLVHKLKELKMRCWSPENSEHSKLIIECFPAEAIWAAKRLGGYLDLSADVVKVYKKQQGEKLLDGNVRSLVTNVLLNSFENLTGLPDQWKKMVRNELIHQMLSRKDWRNIDGSYKGGKFLDDVVDSAICLATALSYANGTAHVWHDLNNPNDGHIIGPGLMQEIQTR